MNFQPNPKQALCLLGMLFGQTETEREPMQSKIKPELRPKERKLLLDAGLLEAQRRGAATHLIATDGAWEWASAHLDTELSASKVAAPILRNVLRQVGKFLAQRDLALADLMLDEAASPPPRDVHDRIRQAIWDIAGGSAKKRVRLAELRDRLGEVPRNRLDSSLLEMQDAGRVVLYRLDNPLELTAADHQAALVIGENPRHLVYLEG